MSTLALTTLWLFRRTLQSGPGVEVPTAGAARHFLVLCLYAVVYGCALFLYLCADSVTDGCNGLAQHPLLPRNYAQRQRRYALEPMWLYTCKSVLMLYLVALLACLPVEVSPCVTIDTCCYPAVVGFGAGIWLFGVALVGLLACSPSNVCFFSAG